ncbi:MAG TPA: O-methyltransferase [Beutenbergiaceae bacterium]|nr:O-methyltransferase [Beutenbergiaceae bacterium]
MADRVSSWVYAEEFAAIPDPAFEQATTFAHEMGLEPLSPATGATLRMIAGLLKARAVVEVNTGTGVSGLWLLAGMHPDGILTTIDDEVEHHRYAKQAFATAGIPSTRTRTISGRAYEVLPRLADEAYDVVYIDAIPTQASDYTDHALRVLRGGGALVIANALWRGRVADPTKRDEQTVVMRQLSKALQEEFTTALLPVGEGLTVVIKP